MSATSRRRSARPRKVGERAASEAGPGRVDGTISGWSEPPARQRRPQRYVLRLYVTGLTTASRLAIERVRAICEQHLHGRYELEVVDIYQMPALAKDDQIIATPTLIKVLPAPLRRFIGNLASVEKVLFGLDLREKR